MKTKEEFFQEGVDAYDMGVAAKLNPYSRGSLEFLQWLGGWAWAFRQWSGELRKK